MKAIPVRHITDHQKERGSSEKFNIRDVKDLTGGKDLTQELHRHDFFFILALQNAKGSHEIDFNTYRLDNHSVFIMRPGQVHQLELKAGCTGYMVEFNAEFYHPHTHLANQRLRKASHRTHCKLDGDRFEQLHSILAHIFQEYAAKQEGYQEVIKASLDILFIVLIRQSQNPGSLSKKANQYEQARLEEFAELLESHIITHKKASQYADLLHLSLYQLNGITKATMGKTASELINEQLILEAKRHLLATPNQVKDIAYHLGYEDVSYFIRFFKKHTGYAPEAFRHNFR